MKNKCFDKVPPPAPPTQKVETEGSGPSPDPTQNVGVNFRKCGFFPAGMVLQALSGSDDWQEGGLPQRRGGELETWLDVEVTGDG